MRAILFAMLALAACAQTGGEAAPPAPRSEIERQILADNERLDRELRAPGISAAGIGETADLGGGLTVRPIEVLEDSRCPMQVDCVWAGRLRLRANVSGAERELTLGETLETPRGDVFFAIAKPSTWGPWPEDEPARAAYRFGFRRG